MGTPDRKPPAPDAAAFESALRANPDDLAGWCAYADYLVEHGDPRGAFMQVQIALEDAGLSKTERAALKKKERALLKKHEKEWVGAWADVVAVPEGNDGSRGELNPTGGAKYVFRRGWITDVNVGRLIIREARALLGAPELRFVRNLFVGYVFYGSDAEYLDEDVEEPDTALHGIDYPSEHVLVRWPQLRYVRRFHWGWPAVEDYGAENRYSNFMSGGQVLNFVKHMPDLEELLIFACVPYDDVKDLVHLPMPNLRVLRFYHGGEYHLDALATNPTLKRLTHLQVHPRAARLGQTEAYIRLKHLSTVLRTPRLPALTHLQLRLTDFGDAGAEEIVRTGALRRLKVLDLRHGCMTDEGAKVLAGSGDLKNLEFLDLSHNALVGEGVRALKETGVKFDASHQHGQVPGDEDDYESRDFLCAGDVE